jgi:hypothetical protein
VTDVDLDYIKGELADIQTELNTFPPSQTFAGVGALTERLEGLEARVGFIIDAFSDLLDDVATEPYHAVEMARTALSRAE